MIKSKSKEKHGITIREALNTIIEKNQRWSPHKTDYVHDGTFSSTWYGGRFQTAAEAIDHHFKGKQHAQEEHDAKAKSATLPAEIEAILNGTEASTRKALRKLRSLAFSGSFCQQHTDGEIDAMFCALKSKLPNFKAS